MIRQRIGVNRICNFFAFTALAATNVLAQPPAPTVKISCTVNYEFVQSYAQNSKNVPALSPQGDYFSGNELFVTRRSLDLYPKKILPSERYKVTLDAAMHSFLSKVCNEDVEPVLSYIDSHEFDDMQNFFYLGAAEKPIPSRAIERKFGDWTLTSWNNQVDRLVD